MLSSEQWAIYYWADRMAEKFMDDADNAESSEEALQSFAKASGVREVLLGMLSEDFKK